MQYDDLLGVKYAHASVPAHLAATATEDFVIFRADKKCRVRKVVGIPSADVTGQSTNYTNINIKSWTTADPPVGTERGSRDYAAASDTEKKAAVRTLYEPATPLTLAAAQALTLEFEKAGTGLALPAMHLIIEYDHAI